jgi:acyl dehydratase
MPRRGDVEVGGAMIIDGTDGLRALAGQHLGQSGAEAISQETVNAFADVSGDHQWIHVDPERAQAGPFGGTIVHGLLTLARAATLAPQVFTVQGTKSALNYGFDKVRYPSPLRVGTPVVLSVEILRCDDVTGGVQVTYRFTMQGEGAPKPVCVADMLVRYFA